MLLEAVVVAFWAMLPAYVPNNVAVVFGGGPPIDGGRTWRGRRLLGDGKTWRGTAGGTLAGLVLAGLLTLAAPVLSALLGLSLPGFPPLAALGLAAGAMVGDIASSFLKRRSGRRRGAPWPGFDQLDFVVGALAAAGLLAPGWFVDVFLAHPWRLVAVLLLTPVLHVGTNGVAYLLGLKDVPY